jgi:hypothetical protein
MTTANHVVQLRAEAAYRRQRLNPRQSGNSGATCRPLCGTSQALG